jgi:predicted CXXCH cytochrome family protein
MDVRFRRVPLLLIAASFLLVGAAPGQNKFKLKPGAEGKLCVSCHAEFEDKLKRKFVHTPVQGGECSGCHNPHTATHGKLLDAPGGTVCVKCHESVIPAKSASAHRVAIEGNCAKCHDPHASDSKGNLVQAGNALCLSCHKAFGEALAKVKFKHTPVDGGCLSCHEAHASEKAPHLLKSSVPAVCLECHDPESASFKRQHVNYPMAKANCGSCHDPHGSNTAGLLRDTVHAPVASKRCTQCHDPATSATPFKTRRPGFELCRGCHTTMMNDTFGKNRVHWPLLDQTGCLNCHEPHAAAQKKLLRVEEARLCGTCHVDTMAMQASLAAKAKQEQDALKGKPIKGSLTHDPVQQGSCTTCHQVHASDHTFLMRQASTVEGCGTCHDWLKHTSHPMGEKHADPRNKNLKLDCLSCHRSHGTGYRHMLTFRTSTDLCVQCHVQRKR